MTKFTIDANPLGEPANFELITNKCDACKGTGYSRMSPGLKCFSCNGTGNRYQTELYRYFDVLFEQGQVALQLERYATIKATACGYWIKYHNAKGKKFVEMGRSKQFAYLTREAALRSYYKRKKAQIKIIKMELERAELALKLTPTEPYSDLATTFTVIED